MMSDALSLGVFHPASLETAPLGEVQGGLIPYIPQARVEIESVRAEIALRVVFGISHYFNWPRP